MPGEQVHRDALLNEHADRERPPGGTAGEHEARGEAPPTPPRRRLPLVPLVLLGIAALGLVVALAVVASGFNSGQQQAPEKLTPAQVQRIANAGSGVLPPTGFQTLSIAAPQFSLPLIDGSGDVSLASLRGKPIVVNFWASTCPPCQREMPAVASVSRALAGKVRFVGVDTKDSSRAAAVAFAHSHGATYPIGFDPAESVGNRYGLVGLPTTYFLSPNGTKIVGEYLGALNGTSLVRIIAQLYHVG